MAINVGSDIIIDTTLKAISETNSQIFTNFLSLKLLSVALKLLSTYMCDWVSLGEWP